MQLTPGDESMLDAFWRAIPQRPQRPAILAIPVGAPTCTITCAACGVRSDIAVDWTGRVCARCRGDLPAAAYRLDSEREQLTIRETKLHETWIAYQADRDDATADVWTRIVQDRDRNAAHCERYAVGKFFNGIDEAERARRSAAASAERDILAAKRERASRKYPAIAELLDRESAYRAGLRNLTDRRAALEVARTEIALAMGEEVPF